MKPSFAFFSIFSLILLIDSARALGNTVFHSCSCEYSVEGRNGGEAPFCTAYGQYRDSTDRSQLYTEYGSHRQTHRDDEEGNSILIPESERKSFTAAQISEVCLRCEEKLKSYSNKECPNKIYKVQSY